MGASAPVWSGAVQIHLPIRADNANATIVNAEDTRHFSAF
jgi:hypothetical protein